ncbi:hypothetical protein EJ05DRAFT_372246 [Pseudovirgaria hyperparasitica]|uniref:Uncharacterized protein n=1 Tax=Pseudovirgaria hyperparasitica TaxID=470096 RepID=A0A6A6W5Q6_9PEZI|nr:uncharacterized protein EJ05DRAFT_372246 [Pseudovirgaria hyperparasitica]KAF2757933.1 hypothetical protein EJ05DRAFT_372246 [Pseudovirgaria hyperparasitica]
MSYGSAGSIKVSTCKSVSISKGRASIDQMLAGAAVGVGQADTTQDGTGYIDGGLVTFGGFKSFPKLLTGESDLLTAREGSVRVGCGCDTTDDIPGTNSDDMVVIWEDSVVDLAPEFADAEFAEEDPGTEEDSGINEDSGIEEYPEIKEGSEAEDGLVDAVRDV